MNRYLKRAVNPQLETAWKPASRKEIYGEEQDLDEENADSQWEALKTLVAGQIEVADAKEVEVDSEETGAAVEEVSYKLIGKGVRTIKLIEEDWVAQRIALPVEDTEEESQERRQRALACAVDGDAILQFNQKYFPRPGEKPVVDFALKDAPRRASTAMIMKRPRTVPSKVEASGLLRNPAMAKVVPMVRVKSPAHPHLKLEKKTKAATARFFRPQWEWGGKSRGYALGYPRSRPRVENYY